MKRTGQHRVQAVICSLLLLPLLMMAGCTTLVPDDPNMPLGDFDSGSRTEKAWRVERKLVSNEVNCIAADSHNIWFATQAGVSRWNRDQDQWFHYTMEDGLSNDAVNAVAIDGQWVWFATEEGVSRYDTETNTFSTYRTIDGLASDQVSSIAVDGNYVWFGTSDGLNRYDKTIDSWAVRSRKDGLVSKVITAIAVEPEYVWVGTDREINPDPHGWDDDPRFSKGGVSRYHRDTDSWNNYKKSDGLIDDEIATIAVDENSVWFGTQDEGVSQYNQVDQAFIKTFTKSDLLKSNMISCIRADGFQVWFGTANAGVHRFIKPVNTWVHYTKEDGLASNHVSWITTQGNDVWFASKEDGVSRFDKVTGKWTLYKQADFLTDNDVRDITRDAEGNLWLATVSGISIYQPQTRSWEIISKEDGLPSPYVTKIDVTSPLRESGQSELIEISSGGMTGAQVWIGTDRGLGTRLSSGGEWTFYSPPRSETDGEAFVTAIVADGAVLWLGTSLGLAMYDRTSQEWTQLETPGDHSNAIVLSVLVRDGMVWFGGAAGVWRYSIADKKMHHAAEGLPDTYVNALFSAEDILWAGTRQGVARYDVAQGRWIPMPFNAQLPAPNITALDFRDGILWIGTPQGLGSYTIASEVWRLISNVSYNIRDILCDAEETLWLATSVGLVEYHLSDGGRVLHQSRPVREPFLETKVSNIKFDGDYIWFNNWASSPNGGILRFHRPTGTWQRFTRLDILQSTQKRSMTTVRWSYVDTDAVWFTTDYGVLRYDKMADTWQHFTIEDGLSANDADKIAVSEHSVWVIPMIGVELSHYSKKTGKWNVIAPKGDMQIERLNALAVDGAEVWFGSGPRTSSLQ